MAQSSIPLNHRAVVLDAPNSSWAIRTVPTPRPQPGEILIKVQACGVCHSDLHIQQGAFGADTFPRTPGHEVIGTVVAVGGEGDDTWKVGDRVGGGWHGGHCGKCSSCRQGTYQCCDQQAVNGFTRDGGYAEYCVLRAEAAVRIPADADAAACAPLLCAGVTVFNGIRKMNIGTGETVAVQGLGGLGHLAVQYARRMGYRTVAISTSSSKKDFALELGATDFIDTSAEDASEALQRMGGASLVVVTAPNAKAVSPLMKGLAPMGKLLLLAAVGEITMDTTPLVLRGTSVHGWPSGHALDSEGAIDFAARQSVKCMVETFPFDKVDDAVQRMATGQVRFRSVVVMSE